MLRVILQIIITIKIYPHRGKGLRGLGYNLPSAHKYNNIDVGFINLLNKEYGKRENKWCLRKQVSMVC